MSVIFLFVDGVGLGKVHGENPLTSGQLTTFSRMAGGRQFSSESDTVNRKDHLFKGIDAKLGIEGLPQSGTGQTTLFTGVNAAREIGKHFGPFPHSGIKPLLKNRSLFHRAIKNDKKASFINAYPDIFFERAESNDRWSCTTLMAKSAGIPLKREKDVREEKAVTAGITQEAWRDKLNIDVPRISPEKAARRILESAKNYDLILYEYYLTDKAGHSQDAEMAREVLAVLDRFLSVLIEEKSRDDTLLLSSDHGNIEDLSVKTHTYNEVPLVVVGPEARKFSKAESIMDITPNIIPIL